MVLNPTSAVILGLLLDGPATGGEIVASAQHRLVAQGGVTRSQVFRELPGLLSCGFVEESAEKIGQRVSRSYRLTTSGRSVFGDWMLTPLGADTVRSAAVLRLGFGVHMSPHQRTAIIEGAVAEHELALTEHLQLAKDLTAFSDEFAIAAAEFAVAYERTVLTWLRTFPLA